MVERCCLIAHDTESGRGMLKAGMTEQRNGGITEWRKMTPNPKRWNHRTVEWRNGGMAERWNGRK